jgi:hypothetical protein
LEAKEIGVKKKLLYDYLTYNFRPQFSEEKRRAWSTWFVLYWLDRITYDELYHMCNIEEQQLKDCFSIFLNLGE